MPYFFCLKREMKYVYLHVFAKISQFFPPSDRFFKTSVNNESITRIHKNAHIVNFCSVAWFWNGIIHRGIIVSFCTCFRHMCLFGCPALRYGPFPLFWRYRVTHQNIFQDRFSFVGPVRRNVAPAGSSAQVWFILYASS